MKKQTRTLSINGRRTSVQLEPVEWELIDLASERKGTRWTKWAGPLVEALTDGENMTAAIRREASKLALEVLLFDTVGMARPSDLDLMAGNELTAQHNTFDDERLEGFLKTSHVDGVSDFGGFTIHFGTDEYGRDFLAVENQLKDHPHFATVLGNPK